MMEQRTKFWIQRFRQDESGVVTLEFVLIFPIMFAFFLMTVENGIISIRNVMLERGVDIAIRDVRIGTKIDPDASELRNDICKYAGIIPDCGNQLQVEMYVRDPRAWVPLPAQVNCRDRSVEARNNFNFTHGKGNELVVIIACARIDPILPTSRIGRTRVPSIGQAIIDNGDARSAGSYALVATSSYVVEPRDDD